MDDLIERDELLEELAEVVASRSYADRLAIGLTVHQLLRMWTALVRRGTPPVEADAAEDWLIDGAVSLLANDGWAERGPEFPWWAIERRVLPWVA